MNITNCDVVDRPHVSFGDTYDEDGSIFATDDWRISAISGGTPHVFLGGFGRKADAAIGLAVIREQFEFPSTFGEIRARWKELGREDGLRKLIAERLQW